MFKNPIHFTLSYHFKWLIILFSATTLLLSVGLILATPENATLAVIPSQTTVAPNDTVTITVTLTTLDAEPFGTWKVHLDFDDTVLQLDTVVPNEDVVPPVFDANDSSVPGSIIVTDGAFSNNAGSSQPYTLLTATFTALAGGSSNFTVVTDPTFPENETNYGDVETVPGTYWIPGNLDVGQITVSESPTATPTPTATATATATPTHTPTHTATPTDTPTNTPTATTTSTYTPTATETAMPTATATETLTPTPTATNTATPTNTAVPPTDDLYLPLVQREGSG